MQTGRLFSPRFFKNNFEKIIKKNSSFSDIKNSDKLSKTNGLHNITISEKGDKHLTANLIDSLYTGAKVGAVNDVAIKKTSGQASFTDVMDAQTGKNVEPTKAQENTPTDKPVKVDSYKNEISDRRDQISTQKTETADHETVVDKTAAATEKIAEKVCVEFDITDEELTEAMEVLGLTMVDLLNPDCLKQLLMEVSDAPDSLSLLTNAELYDGMKQVMEFAQETVVNLQNDINIDDAELMNLLQDEGFAAEVTEAVANNEAQVSISTETEVPVFATDRKEVKEDEDVPEKEKSFSKVSVEVTKEDPVRVSAPAAKTITQQAAKEHFEKQQNDAFFAERAGVSETVPSDNPFPTVADVVETVANFSDMNYDPSDIANQVNDFVKVNFNNETTSMELMLHPASLGTVNVQLTSNNGVVTAHLTVQNEAVKAALETQLITLQDTFVAQGQKVEAVEVSVANYNMDNMQQQMQQQMQQNSGQNGQERGYSVRGIRRNINLNDFSEEMEMTEEEQISAEMMKANGNSVDFTA